MHKILVIRFYFPLDVLHISDYISPSSGATFYKLYIAFVICRYQTPGCCVAIGRTAVATHNLCRVNWAGDKIEKN